MPKPVKSKNFREVRVTVGIMVETAFLSFRESRWNNGVVLGPVVKVTSLTNSTSRAYGFRHGEGYSIKEYGGRTRYVGPHAVIIVKGKKWTMREFYNAHVK